MARTKKAPLRASAKVAAKVADHTSAPEVGAFYYVDDDGARTVHRCIAVFPDGSVGLAAGDNAILVDPAKLRRIPATAGEVLRVVGLMTIDIDELEVVAADLSRRAALAPDDDGRDLPEFDTAKLRRLVASLDVWVRGIPGIPAAELR